MKKIVLAAITTLTLASTASAYTTITTIGNSSYINSYSSSGGYSSTVCQYIGTTIYCN